MKIKIDKGIPLPTYGGFNRKYPFGQMKPGDSFSINGSNVASVRYAACQWGKRHKQKFTVRKTGDGHRCWRVK